MRMSDKLQNAARTIAAAYTVSNELAQDTLWGRIEGLVIAVYICDGADYSNEDITRNTEHLIHAARHGLPDAQIG